MTTACARATSTVRSAFPIRSLPSSDRTMYFASCPWHAASNLVMMDTFFVWDWTTSEVRLKVQIRTHWMTSAKSDLLQLWEDIGYRERLGLEQRLLTILRILPAPMWLSKTWFLDRIIAYHCNKAQVSIPFQIRFHSCKSPSRRLSDRLYKQAFSDSQFDTDVIRTELDWNGVVQGASSKEEETILTLFMHK